MLSTIATFKGTEGNLSGYLLIENMSYMRVFYFDTTTGIIILYPYFLYPVFQQVKCTPRKGCARDLWLYHIGIL